MAIYRLSVKPVKRSEGRSATAAAAYRAAELVHDETTGQTFDYTRKRGVEHAEIVLPTAAVKQDINWARDRQALWNEAERVERRSNSRPAREYELALPHEMTREQRVALSGVAKTPILVDAADVVEPPGDFRGSSEYRRALAEILVARALEALS
jgi:hypothetical protein